MNMSRTHIFSSIAIIILLTALFPITSFVPVTYQPFGMLIAIVGAAAASLFPDLFDKKISTKSFRIKMISNVLFSNYVLIFIEFVFLLLIYQRFSVITVDTERMTKEIIKTINTLFDGKSTTGFLIVIGSIIFTRVIGHTKFNHSMCGLFTYGFGIFLFFEPLLIPFVVGYSIHLLVDSLADGVPLLYPFFKNKDNEDIVFGLRLFISDLVYDYLFSFCSLSIILCNLK